MLPKSVDVIRLCKQGAILQGPLVLSALSRLQALCDQGDQVVDVTLTLNTDSHGALFIQGSVKGAVRLICQRCNEEMAEPLDLTFLLSPVNSYERIKKLASTYEPLMITEENVVIAEMIEDEILLALPMVSRHDSNADGECDAAA